MKIKSPIFILGAPKSGTSLLRSLLDNHPELAVIPFEATLFQILGEEISHPYRKNKAKVFEWEVEKSFSKLEKIVEEYNSSISPYIDSSHINMFDWDIKKCKRDFFQLKSKRDLFEYFLKFLVDSYSKIDAKYFEGKRLVEKSIINYEYVFLLQNYFPDAKFIHIVRNPYANLVALRKYKTQNKFPSLPEIVLTLENSYRCLFMNGRNINNYHILKYEDLVIDSKDQLKNISNFLEISFLPDNMLYPTSMGKSWPGNSTSNDAYHNISKKPLHEWKNFITPVETYYINKIFGRVIDAFEYSKFNMNGFYRINKNESVKTYARNRLFKFYINLI